MVLLLQIAMIVNSKDNMRAHEGIPRKGHNQEQAVPKHQMRFEWHKTTLITKQHSNKNRMKKKMKRNCNRKLPWNGQHQTIWGLYLDQWALVTD